MYLSCCCAVEPLFAILFKKLEWLIMSQTIKFNWHCLKKKGAASQSKVPNPAQEPNTKLEGYDWDKQSSFPFSRKNSCAKKHFFLQTVVFSHEKKTCKKPLAIETVAPNMAAKAAKVRQLRRGNLHINWPLVSIQSSSNSSDSSDLVTLETLVTLVTRVTGLTIT